jgi:hypothetical protein
MAAFIAWRSWQGYRQAGTLARLLAAPRHRDLACPSCGQAPLCGPLWTCGRCGQSFDFFDAGGTCPGCGARSTMTECFDCRQRHALDEWRLEESA